ncbi:hypothetical protein FOA52_004707 [Chlamydomonas sp. UWO 241]|nr:hypothetical protein FOA52_004707 [Chlamydomonas sp. UWO 241]
MVKTKTGGGKRFQAAAKAKAAVDAGDADATPAWNGPAPPKHVQRKISRKVGFLDRVAASKAASLGAKAGVTKKSKRGSKALNDLSSLSGQVTELLQQHGAVLSPAGTSGGKAQVARRLKPGTKAVKAGGSGGSGGSGTKAQPVRKAFGSSVGTLKVRTLIGIQEKARVVRVLAHPLYKLDPFQAITNHLTATLPAAPVPPRAGVKQVSNSKKKKAAGAGLQGEQGGGSQKKPMKKKGKDKRDGRIRLKE